VGRLFDSGAETRKADAAREARAEVRRRAREAEEAIREIEELDEASAKLGETLAAAQAVQPIVYATFRRPGTRWSIEHARVGDDYVYQLFPLKPEVLDWQDVVAQMITAMDVIFPRSVKIRYVPPNQAFKVKFYTIRVTGVVGQPGWEKACRERALNGLSAVDAWTVP
jgi:hypothetical protein